MAEADHFEDTEKHGGAVEGWRAGAVEVRHRHSSFVIRHSFSISPAVDEAVFDMELVADAGDDEVDEILNAGYAVVEAGHGGQDHGAGLGRGMHVGQLGDGERRFTRHEDQRAAFLELDLGRSMDEVGRRAVDDGAECPARARADHHPVGEEGAAGDGRHEVFVVVVEDGSPSTISDCRATARRIEIVEIVDVYAEFLLDDESCGRADRQVDVATGSAENVEQTHRVGRAAGSGDGHDELAFHFVPT